MSGSEVSLAHTNRCQKACQTNPDLHTSSNSDLGRIERRVKTGLPGLLNLLDMLGSFPAFSFATR
ncbi:hypothetical protein EAE96_010569 [Botrytis aclada]|nr:hypothetical protein EAE96_010569 [Botrytis aclada]